MRRTENEHANSNKKTLSTTCRVEVVQGSFPSLRYTAGHEQKMELCQDGTGREETGWNGTGRKPSPLQMTGSETPSHIAIFPAIFSLVTSRRFGKHTAREEWDDQPGIAHRQSTNLTARRRSRMESDWIWTGAGRMTPPQTQQNIKAATHASSSATLP